MAKTSRRRFLKEACATVPLLSATQAFCGNVIHASWTWSDGRQMAEHVASNDNEVASLAPVSVLNRPFSVEPVTGIMLPDGIFDSALRKQIITCFVTNTSSAPLDKLNVYLEGVGDPGIQVTGNSISIPTLATGASVKVGWLADFSKASPGKHFVTIRVGAENFAVRRLFKRIFVSKTHYDHASKTYVCEVPEGTLRMHFSHLIGPKCANGSEELSCPGPWLVDGFTAYLDAPFSGQYGPLPFEDPLWKIIAAIIAVLAFLGSELLKAGGDNGSTVRCDTDPANGQQVCQTSGGYAAALSTIAGMAATTALADRKDPWIRGREATTPSNNERTLTEMVSASIEYPSEITAGDKYSTKINWSYRRITNAGAYSHSVTETVNNEYVMKGIVIRAPARVSLSASPKLRMEVQITRESGEVYKGADLIMYTLLEAPNGEVVRVNLGDDGIVDDAPNDGWYTGEISIYAAAESAHLADPRGIWKISALAQTVNGAREGMTPIQAAQFIGGVPVAAPVSLSFGASACSRGHFIQVEIVS